MAGATTSTTVRVNAKLESIQLMKLQAPAAGTAIAAGKFVTRGSDGRAALGATTDRFVYLVFQGNDRSDSSDTQNSPMADLDSANAITLETGGITVIPGYAGFEVGLPASLITNTAAVGSLITCGASGAVTATTYAVPAAAATYDTTQFGIVTKIENGIVWFLFNSIGVRVDNSI